jgi:hypothetical protein
VFPALGELTVLADGLLIWRKYDDLPEGANSLSTGLLEQRLTPEGVELMRSEASAALSSGEPQQGCVEGYDDGYVVYPGEPGAGGVLHADDEHLARLIDPWSWLPASAWEDPEIRAYVPSAYVVRIPGDSHERESLDPEIRAQLPAAAADLLDANRIDGDAYERQLGYAKLTPDEARAFAAALDGAGLEQDELWNAYQLSYEFVHDGTVVRIEFFVYDLYAMMVYPGTPPGA